MSNDTTCIHGNAVAICERIHVGDRVTVFDATGPWDQMIALVTEIKGSTAEDISVEFDHVVLLAVGYEAKELSFTESELVKHNAE